MMWRNCECLEYTEHLHRRRLGCRSGLSWVFAPRFWVAIRVFYNCCVCSTATFQAWRRRVFDTQIISINIHLKNRESSQPEKWNEFAFCYIVTRIMKFSQFNVFVPPTPVAHLTAKHASLVKQLIAFSILNSRGVHNLKIISVRKVWGYLW